MLTDQQIIAKYGKPGDEDNFVVIPLPYPMVLAYPPYSTVTKMRCHKLLAPTFTAVFNEILAAYGLEKIKELDIDKFAGCVAVRLQRGSKNKWSRHSWGIAIDLSPAKNGLKTKWAQSQFAKPEYAKLHQIFEKHGFINYGKVRGFDAMHFEINN